MKVRRGFVHVQHHVEHMEMGIPLLKALCVLNQSLRCPLAALRTAAAVIQIADLEDGLMEQLLLLALPDMLVVVWDLIPCLFLPGVVCLQCLVEDLMVDLFQIIVSDHRCKKSHSAPSGSGLHSPLKISGCYAGYCPGQSCRK